jgi:hypothetical protein
MLLLLKGVFETKPALPRYTCIWDVEIVLKYLKNLGPNTELTLKLLTLKLVMLLGLLSGQRCQTLHSLNIEDKGIKTCFSVDKFVKNICTY